MTATPPRAVRLDKWLWAARFFKTRSLAKTAIENGKVLYNEQRAKVSREVEIGATLLIRQGWDQVEVVVASVSDQRGPAPVARELYNETPASIEERERRATERRAAGEARVISPDRPSKKQRRQIHRFVDRNLNQNLE